MHKSIAFVCGGIGDQLYHFTQMQALAERDHRGQIDIACLHPAIIFWVNKNRLYNGVDAGLAKSLIYPARAAPTASLQHF